MYSATAETAACTALRSTALGAHRIPVIETTTALIPPIAVHIATSTGG
ncbi:hypothetical protein ACQGAO_20325 [Rhodococcus sp. 1.20]